VEKLQTMRAAAESDTLTLLAVKIGSWKAA